QVQRREQLGHAPRLVAIDGQGTPGLDVAEATRPRADVAQDHHRERAMVPALADVRDSLALAHRVEPELFHHALELVVALAPGHGHPQPGRVPATWRGGIRSDGKARDHATP